jgi:hypothetical protein
MSALCWTNNFRPPPRSIFEGVYSKIVGELGKLGRVSGYFDSIHALAWPDEKTLFLANEFSYRFDRVELQ